MNQDTPAQTTLLNRRLILRGMLGCGAVQTLASCANSAHRIPLGSLYSAAAQHDEIDRNPIIVIPGIMGSRLRDERTDDKVWGILGGNSNREFPRLALPMRTNAALHDLTDDVVPDGVLDRVKVSLLATLSVKAYAQILATLGSGGYRDQSLGRAGVVDYGKKHYTCFQFDYDWRRSNAENAAVLQRFIQAKRRYVEAEHRKRFGRRGNVKFDIVAHSMGGLVARYFMMYGGAPLPDSGTLPALTWAGAKDVERVILVGTPNGGSAVAIKQLIEGYKPAPFIATYPPAILGTLPSIYELFPHGREAVLHGAGAETVDLWDSEVWASRHLGILNPRQSDVLRTLLPDVADDKERLEIARDHLRKCLTNAARFQAALDRSAKLPPGVSLHLFAGDAEPTMQALSIDVNDRLRVTQTVPGDGTVTRRSAMGDRRPPGSPGRVQTTVQWSGATFIAADHLGITRDPTFSDNVLHLLLER